MRRTKFLTFLASGLMIAGCAPDAPTPATQPALDVVAPGRPAPLQFTAHGGLLQVFHMDVYQLSVPLGAVSDDAEFWKRVDEQRVDPATYDLLLKNGVRVGVAPTADWAFFKNILEANKASTTKGTATAGGAGSLTIPVKKAVPFQYIFYLIGQDKLYGRSYDMCDDLLGVSYWPEPRKPAEMRVDISPTVRSNRTRLEYRLNGEEREFVQVTPEYLYDLNLHVVIPANSFLIVAPTLVGRSPSSLGHTFLVTDGEADQKEQVLVFVPRMANALGPITEIAGPATPR